MKWQKNPEKRTIGVHIFWSDIRNAEANTGKFGSGIPDILLQGFLLCYVDGDNRNNVP
jgi:hypothetical protein